MGKKEGVSNRSTKYDDSELKGELPPEMTPLRRLQCHVRNSGQAGDRPGFPEVNPLEIS